VLLQDFVYSTLNVFLREDQEAAYQVLLRRLSSVTVFLIYVALPERYSPSSIARSFHDVGLFPDFSGDKLQNRVQGFRDAGKRYVEIACQLGGLGAVWWLPLEVARTAYVLHKSPSILC
jgi:hypothetical protein